MNFVLEVEIGVQFTNHGNFVALLTLKPLEYVVEGSVFEYLGVEKMLGLLELHDDLLLVV